MAVAREIPDHHAALLVGHVPGAINIDWHARDFNDHVAKLEKSKTYLVHCQAGVRSAAASKRMTEDLNFLHVYDFSGGFATYDKAKEPVCRLVASWFAEWGDAFARACTFISGVDSRARADFQSVVRERHR